MSYAYFWPCVDKHQYFGFWVFLKQPYTDFCIHSVFILNSCHPFDIITIMTILLIELKGTIEIFFTISSLHRKLSPTRMLKWPGRNCVQIMCNTSGAHHMQHVMCPVVWRDSSAVVFDRLLNGIYFSFISVAETSYQRRIIEITLILGLYAGWKN